jgi:hypothetical protein
MDINNLAAKLKDLYPVMRSGREYHIELDDSHLLVFMQTIFFGFTPEIRYQNGSEPLQNLFPREQCRRLMELFNLELERRELKGRLNSVNNLIILKTRVIKE